MAFDNDFGSRPPRQMHDVSALGIKCAECGTAINELPFEPRGDRDIYCRDCNSNRRPAAGSRFGNDSRPPRQMHDVTAMGLKCAECSVDITELPFEPRGDRDVYCRDCNRNRRRF